MLKKISGLISILVFSTFALSLSSAALAAPDGDVIADHGYVVHEGNDNECCSSLGALLTKSDGQESGSNITIILSRDTATISIENGFTFTGTIAVNAGTHHYLIPVSDYNGGSVVNNVICDNTKNPRDISHISIYGMVESKTENSAPSSEPSLQTYSEPTSTPEIIDIPDEMPPIADAPPATNGATVIIDNKTPKAPRQSNQVEILDEGLPLSDVPQTGDSNNITVLIALMFASFFGIAGLLLREDR